VQYVLYVDSERPHQPLSQYVIRQLICLFHGKVDDNSKLQVSIVPSTPQPSGYDCGVYAAAYATKLASSNSTGMLNLSKCSRTDARQSKVEPKVRETSAVSTQ